MEAQLPPEEWIRLERSRCISRAMFSYIPPHYDGTITVTSATEGRRDASIDQVRHWRSIAADVDATTIPGNHTSIVTSDIAGLGAVLRAQLSHGA
jgi:thioesterase domain-containing protein